MAEMKDSGRGLPIINSLNAVTNDRCTRRRRILIHYPGKIEQIWQGGKEVVIGLPLCGNTDGFPMAAESDSLETCEDCQRIALTLCESK